ncbi:hypothetical protein BD410DRAFT_789273 [Rickenella mellea]|uniref:Transmembrane protein n=1 Tax=Rickenella mellea TaxID=50990 RepID=A0A4Y7Q3K0_9AGAM|nr:hypothetical protein BD410DRAFT_789273 [Rickenella mellea]
MSSLSSQYQYQYQPCPQAPMYLSSDSQSEKHQSQMPDATASECAHYPQSQSRCCHNQRRRKIKAILIALSSTFLILALLGLVSFQCGMFSGDNWGDGLMKRAITSTTSNGQSVFVKNKLYLIVAIVGLFLVLILAIMLSAWCCRGSFRNPLCCPCYLCACCGGLACLECISCGLCAEGLEQVDF